MFLVNFVCMHAHAYVCACRMFQKHARMYISNLGEEAPYIQIYIYIYIYIYIHTYTHKHIHTRTHIVSEEPLHACTYEHLHACTYTWWRRRRCRRRRPTAISGARSNNDFGFMMGRPSGKPLCNHRIECSCRVCVCLYCVSPCRQPWFRYRNRALCACAKHIRSPRVVLRWRKVLHLLHGSAAKIRTHRHIVHIVCRVCLTRDDEI